MSITGYLRDVSKEMNKVNWPSQQELISNTTIVIIASLFVSLCIFGADQVISRVLELLVYNLAG